MHARLCTLAMLHVACGFTACVAYLRRRYVSRLQPLVAATGKGMIQWQGAFDVGVMPSKDTVIQVRRSLLAWTWLAELTQAFMQRSCGSRPASATCWLPGTACFYRRTRLGTWTVAVATGSAAAPAGVRHSNRGR